MKLLLVTGSSGLIGSEVVSYFSNLGWEVHGASFVGTFEKSEMRHSKFFGLLPNTQHLTPKTLRFSQSARPEGDTRWNQARLLATHEHFVHHELDIGNRRGVETLISELRCLPLEQSFA